MIMNENEGDRVELRNETCANRKNKQKERGKGKGNKFEPLSFEIFRHMRHVSHAVVCLCMKHESKRTSFLPWFCNLHSIPDRSMPTNKYNYF